MTTNTEHPKKRLKHQFTRYSFYSGLALVVLMVSLVYITMSYMLTETVSKHTETAVYQSARYVQSYVDHIQMMGDMLADDEDTLLFLKLADQEARSRLQTMLNTLLKSEEHLVTAAIVSSDGELISTDPDLDMMMSPDMQALAWYQDAIKDQEHAVLSSAKMQSFSMDKSSWVIAVSKEIIGESGQHLGVVLLEFSYHVLESYLVDLDLGRSGYAFIVNGAGHLVYHKDTAYFTDESLRDELLLICDLPSGEAGSPDEIAYKQAVGGTDWVLVGVSSLDSIQIMKRQLLEILSIIALALLVVMIMSGRYTSHMVTQPLEALVLAMTRVKTGLTKVHLKDKGCLEVDQLASHYNDMIDQLVELMATNEANQVQLKEYAIQALQSQINPHFLYNTLDLIIWMGEFGDGEKVVRVTKALAEFFRISLSQGKELIPLSEEIRHVQHYLFIQKERYGDQLAYELTCQPDLEDWLVPKVILQPLVENAIYHGIKEKDGGGRVKVHAQANRDTVTITVEDDGRGFDQELAPKTHVTLGGIGLKNVEARLKLFYGSQAKLRIDTALGQGTLITLSLPRTP